MDGKVVAIADPGNPRRVNLSFQADSVSNDDVEESLYQMAKEAAGKNEILEKGEFEKWSTAHYRQMMAWPDRAIARGKRWFKENGYLDEKKFYGCTPTGQAEACHAVEFKNFLKNFTLSDERTVNEVGLWKEYLVYASFYGIADQVRKDMKKVAPDTLKLDELIPPHQVLENFKPITTALNTSLYAAYMYETAYEREKRYSSYSSSDSSSPRSYSSSSGGSGHSSYSGGGGHTGGGGSGFR